MKFLVIEFNLLVLVACCCMQVVHLSSIGLDRKWAIKNSSPSIESPLVRMPDPRIVALSPAIELESQTETISAVSQQLAIDTLPSNPGGSQTGDNVTSATTKTPLSTTSSTPDPNFDLDEPPLSQIPQDNSTNKVPNKNNPGGGGGGGGNTNIRGDNSTGDNRPVASERANIELSVLWYSVFMVYVSFIKLIYHNVAIIKRNITEPGILMIFGIIWELISRQLNLSLDSSPRFNSRIFFYLFLPSTVLESASILSNRWLLINLLPILIHSIVGTLLYGSAIAFTIYSMSKQDMFDIGTTSMGGISTTGPTSTPSPSTPLPTAPPSPSTTPSTATSMKSARSVTATLFEDNLSSANQWFLMDASSSPNHQTPPLVSSNSRTTPRMMMMNDDSEESNIFYEKGYVINAPMLEVGNLTLADCLVFGSIMSSLDSTTMLGAFSMFQVNEKLYYLVLGETLMNNAVVLIVFNLLLDFLNASRLTVFKIYIAIIQFFITLIGSIFVGLLLASVALLAVRLIKQFQVPSALTSYQNQCLAMIETLLVLKLAYLTYTLGNLTGLSSIVSLATFGVLQDQYIRLNLNLRSQLTFRQVVLATKTMGFSLVYPLLGMLLVDVAYANQYVQQTDNNQAGGNAAAASSSPSLPLISESQRVQQPDLGVLDGDRTLAITKLTSLAQQASLLWNFKFLSLVTVISIVYRFGIVIVLSLFCNLISNRRVKLRFREQLMMAYGGLKGPLAVALVHRLIEHEDHRERLLRNKHLFMYTILSITFLSVIFKGAFIRRLVEKMQMSLHHPRLYANQKDVLFNAINNKVIECATHAMNCLIGRSKSPYDRLFEFNESRIKPWLARDGSNTNWLSNLHDKLLLDETLDSNCFYKSTEEPIAGSFWHSKIQLLAKQHRGSKTSVRQLKTINEHGGDFIDDDELNTMNSHLSLGNNHQQNAINKRQMKDNLLRRSKNGDSSWKRDTELKEFVMRDMKKFADSNQTSKRTSKSVSKVEPEDIEAARNIPRSSVMLSSSSGGEWKERRQSSSDKDGYISMLEKHLESRRKPKNQTVLIRKSKNNQRVDAAPIVSPPEESLQPPHGAGKSRHDVNHAKMKRHEGRNKIHKRNKQKKEKFAKPDPTHIVTTSSSD